MNYKDIFLKNKNYIYVQPESVRTYSFDNMLSFMNGGYYDDNMDYFIYPLIFNISIKNKKYTAYISYGLDICVKAKLYKLQSCHNLTFNDIKRGLVYCWLVFGNKNDITKLKFLI